MKTEKKERKALKKTTKPARISKNIRTQQKGKAGGHRRTLPLPGGKKSNLLFPMPPANDKTKTESNNNEKGEKTWHTLHPRERVQRILVIRGNSREIHDLFNASRMWSSVCMSPAPQQSYDTAHGAPNAPPLPPPTSN